MPSRYEYDPQARRFETRFFGRVTADEIAQNLLDILHSDEWMPGTARLTIVEADADLSDVTIEVMMDRFVGLVEDARPLFGGPCKTAWVFETDINSVIGKLWESLPTRPDSESFKAFSNRQDALHWLSIPRD